MKKRKTAHRRKKYTIALLYHYVPEEITDKYFSAEHALVDNQTDEIVDYMHRLFRRRGYRVQIIKVEPDDLSNLKRLKADFVFNLVDSKAMELRLRVLGRLKILTPALRFAPSKRAIKTPNQAVVPKSQLPTPNYSFIRLNDRMSRRFVPKISIIIKPAFEHCSIGITDRSITQNYQQFKDVIRKLRKTHRQGLLAEELFLVKNSR